MLLGRKNTLITSRINIPCGPFPLTQLWTAPNCSLTFKTSSRGKMLLLLYRGLVSVYAELFSARAQDHGEWWRKQTAVIFFHLTAIIIINYDHTNYRSRPRFYWDHPIQWDKMYPYCVRQVLVCTRLIKKKFIFLVGFWLNSKQVVLYS